MKKAAFLYVLLSILYITASAQNLTFETKRHSYERGEEAVIVLKSELSGNIDFDISGWLAASVPVQNGRAEYRIDTNLLRAGKYLVRARLEDGREQAVFAFNIGPEHDDQRLPVWRWGVGGGDMEWAKETGFTGAFHGWQSILEDPDQKHVQMTRSDLEQATQLDYELGIHLLPLRNKELQEREDLHTQWPDGARRPRPKLCPLEPEVMEYAKEMTKSWMKEFHEYPGLRHLMFNSEQETPFCTNEVVRQLAVKEIGLDPKDFVLRAGEWFHGELVKPSQEELADGIIEDDYPLYRFKQWWWKRGHGTTMMNAEMADIAKDYKPSILTWSEPYRRAPVRHAHKGLDCIGSWTYGYPDIKHLGYTAVLHAAARPDNQLVHQDITLFVYARVSIPLDNSTADLFNDFSGSDPYFLASPDYAREATWLVISQRPDILAYFAPSTLLPDIRGRHVDPFYGSPETFDAIGQVCEQLIQPYGPAFLKCERTPARTAVLLSAAATWFSPLQALPLYQNMRIMPYCALLMMNHVPYEVVLAEDIAEGRLDLYDVLVIPRAHALTRTTFEKTKEFIDKGGHVIADSSLKADLQGADVVDYDFSYYWKISGEALAKGDAITLDEGRAIKEGYADDLAPRVEKVPRPASSSSKRVLTNTLDGGAVRYAFFINDDRTYGPRFGQYQINFENGVTHSATMSMAIDGRPVLYDALLRQRLDYKEQDGRAAFHVRLAPAQGKLIAALTEAISRVKVSVPEESTAGESVKVGISVLGESGNAIEGVLPLEVEVFDADGNPTEWKRFIATEDGEAEYKFTPAINDVPGEWTVRVTELLSEIERKEKILVQSLAW